MFSTCPTSVMAEMPVAAQQLELLIHHQPQHQQQVGPEPDGGHSGSTQIYAAAADCCSSCDEPRRGRWRSNLFIYTVESM